MPADLKTRLTELEAGLAEFDAKDSAPAGIADLFNALLSEAKKERGSDPVIAAIAPVEKSFEGSEFAEINCGALSANIQQILAAL